MFPMWFFIVLILTICYLLYLTRRTEDDFMEMSKNNWKKFQVWMKGSAEKYESR
jgi:hypothetical protein